MGQTLRTKAHEVYRALIEATAFGARTIIDLIVGAGVPIDQIVVGGGIAAKSPLVLQIYADVCGRPIYMASSEQTSALGAAICGAVAGRAHRTIEDGVGAMASLKDEVIEPKAEAVSVYAELYSVYCALHDAFGTVRGGTGLRDAMRRLWLLREQAALTK